MNFAGFLSPGNCVSLLLLLLCVGVEEQGILLPSLMERKVQEKRRKGEEAPSTHNAAGFRRTETQRKIWYREKSAKADREEEKEREKNEEKRRHKGECIGTTKHQIYETSENS